MIIRYIVIFILMSNVSFVSAQNVDTQIPKNIILFIGDGMGVAQLSAGKTVAGRLIIEEFRTVALITTHAFDS